MRDACVPALMALVVLTVPAGASLDPSISHNVTCQIGVPVAVLFEGLCEEPLYKNSWFPGDGMLIEDVQNFTYVYESAGAYTVTHVCTPTEGEAVSDEVYITVGPEGTVCEDDCGGPGDYPIETSKGEEPNYLIVGATLGLLFSMIVAGRDSKK